MATRIHRTGVATVALVLLALCSGGCSVYTLERDDHYVDENFAMEQLADANVAVGGVVMAADVPVHACTDLPDSEFALNHLAQADRWSYALYEELTTAGAGREVWGWPAVRDLLTEEDRARLLDSYAGHGHLDADLLLSLDESLPGVDYLCLARVGDSRLERLTQIPGLAVSVRLADPAAAWDRVDLVPSPRGDPTEAVATGQDKERPSGVVGRTIWMTLDFYDLKAGYSVATVKAAVNVDTNWWTNQPPAENARPMHDEDEAQPLIRVAGSTRYAPPLCDTITACLGSLVTGLER